MSTFRSVLLTTLGCAIVIGGFALATPNIADAQLFPRFYQRHCCPDPCPTWRVRTVCVPQCCVYGDVNTPVYYSTYGVSGNPFATTQPAYADYQSTWTTPEGYDGQNRPWSEHARSDRDLHHRTSEDMADEFDTSNSSFVITPPESAEREDDRWATQNDDPSSDDAPYLDRRQEQTNKRSNSDQQQALTAFYAGKLYLHNHCTVELSQIATDHSNNDDVKQFAEELARDHRQLNSKLRSLAPNEIVSSVQTTSQGESRSDSSLAESDKDQTDTEFDATTDEQRRTTVGRANYDVSTDPIVQKMCDVERQAAQNGLKSAREMLTRSTGDDFDLSFVGMQIAKHSMMLAELNALKNVGSPEFQRIVSDAISTIERHQQSASNLHQRLEQEISSNDASDDQTANADRNR